MLNGSDSRFYSLWIASDNAAPRGPARGGVQFLSGPPFVVIGTDTALLPQPVPVDRLTIAPGERYDVIVDFAAFPGRTLIVRNNGRSPFPGGDTGVVTGAGNRAAQCHTYRPGRSNRAMMRVTSPGYMIAVSFQPASCAAGGFGWPSTLTLPRRTFTGGETTGWSPYCSDLNTFSNCFAMKVCPRFVG